MPAVALQGTIDTWNAMVEAGEDAQYGRVMGVEPIDTAPFVVHRNRSGEQGFTLPHALRMTRLRGVNEFLY